MVMIRHAVELMEVSLLWSWATAGFCALLSVILTALLIRIAGRRGWVVVPRQDRWSTRTVAQFGGVPILIAFITGSVFFTHTTAGFALPLLTLGAGVLGFWDDINGLGPRPKLSVELVLASLAIYFGYVVSITPWFAANVLITILWILGITNANNLIDNMDGLAAGIAAIGLVPIIVLSGPDVQTRTLALCMFGALLGFLVFNVHPAKVFMGDSGALAIGFFLACAALRTATRFPSLGAHVLIPVLAAFIPLFDMLLVCVTRRLRGRHISRGARDHSSHRLVLMGMKDGSAVLVLYAFAIGASVNLLIWKLFMADFGAGLIAVFLLLAALFWVQLAKLRVPDSWLSNGMTAAFQLRKPVQQVVGMVFESLLDSGLIAAGLYLAFVCKLGSAFTPADPRFVVSCVLSIILIVPVLAVLRSSTHNFAERQMSRRAEAFMIVKEVVIVATLTTLGMGLVFLWKPFPLSVLILSDVFSSLLVSMSRLPILRLARISARVAAAEETDEVMETAGAKSS